MLQDGATWFLLADGRRARVLSEARRGATLEEIDDWSIEINEDELYDAQDRPPRGHASATSARYAMDGRDSLHDREEENFVRRVADRMSNDEKHGHFVHLVIAAPPRALGLLRAMLSPAAQARVRATEAKDLLSENESQLRERLGELLRS